MTPSGTALAVKEEGEKQTEGFPWSVPHKVVSVRIPEKDIKAIDRISKKRNVSRSHIVKQAVEAYLEKLKQEKNAPKE